MLTLSKQTNLFQFKTEFWIHASTEICVHGNLGDTTIYIWLLYLSNNFGATGEIKAVKSICMYYHSLG
uniref:Uncharacterized protein n=1 Tax=Arundo donax TaxID=35708 RepID=A0A0A9TFH3_ARUDO